MDLRELKEHELHILVELCRAGLRDAVSPAVLRRLLLDGPGDLAALQLGLWEDRRLVGAALGGLRATPGGPVGGPRLLVVAPAERGRGLATRLMDELETRLRAAGVVELRVGGLAPNYLWPGLDPRDTAALCLFEGRGYQRTGEAVNMGVALTGEEWWDAEDEAHLAATGWVVRRATPTDAETLAAWVAARFSDLWAWEARAALAIEPPAAFVAERDGQIGAFACHSVSGLPGTFGPTGTDPGLRGAGLGRALLRRCLADLQAQGYAEVEIGWVGPVKFYSRAAGATISRVCWFLQKTP